MANTKRKNNKYFNTYTIGGWINNANAKLDSSSFGRSLGGSSGIGAGMLANTMASTLNSTINPNSNNTGVGNALQGVGSVASFIPGVGGVIGAGVNLVGGLVNAAFGSNLNEDFIAQTEAQTRQQAGYTSSARDNTALLNDWGSFTNLSHVRKSQVGSDGWFSNKASDKTRSLNKEIDRANRRAWYSLNNTANNIDINNDMLAMANYSAYGGPILSTGAIGYDLALKDLNNKQMKALGDMRLTSLPNSFNALPDMKSINTFGKGGNIRNKNIMKQHSFGGWLNSQGGDFTNGVTYIDNGGSHESNPFEGIQMGIDPEGIPNLVEEGEVVFNDYVFSDRTKVPKKLKDKYNIKGETFAQAAKELSKESEERPNDPISKRGLEAFMNALIESQEEIRIENEMQKINKYAKGGKLGKKYVGDGPYDNYLDYGTLATPITYDQVMNAWNLNVNPGDIPLTGSSDDIDRAILNNSKPGTNRSNNILPYLRYMPAVMSGISAISDIFSKPDYSAANTVSAVDIQPALVSASPIGQYLSYKPMDRMFYINQLNKNTASGRRAVQNNAGGNRAAAMAGILASDYNYGENLGQLARQSEEYNQALRERIAGFNRQTDMFNSQQSLQAQTANAQSRNDAVRMRLAQAGEVAQLRQAARNAYDMRRSNNLNNFINNLGNIGWQEYQREMINTNPALLYNLSGLGSIGYRGFKKGGKLKKGRK